MAGPKKRPQKRKLLPPRPPPEPAPLTIVGVGASAGGLEAFSSLLEALPERPGIAIECLQHLAPQHESALVPLLSGHSSLPVVQAADGMGVEANTAYVIPPN